MRFSSSNEALVELSSLVLQKGSIIAPRDLITRELFGIQFTITNPRARIVTLPSRKFSLPLAVGELCWHLRGDRDVDALAYYASAWRKYTDDNQNILGSCYGRKLLDQTGGVSSPWDRLVSLLRHDQSTRRAVFTFIMNDEDLRFSRDISCVSNIQFLIRDGQLHLFTFMRSNDLYLGLPYDVFLFTYFQELMCLELGLEMGDYHHHATSLHIYEHDFAACEKISQERDYSDGCSPIARHKDQLLELASIETRIRNGEYVSDGDGPFVDYVQALLAFREKKKLL